MSRLAGAAQGVAARRDLLDAGVSDEQIGRRLRIGSLIEEFPGVYRVGHRAPNPLATHMAAVLAAGPGAVIAGCAAAWLWGLVKGAAPPPEVISLTERRIEGVITHRARRQPGADVAVHRGIPVTTVARTLVDLAAGMGPADLANACHEAGVKHDTTPAQVDSVLKRRPTSKGAGKLRRVMRGEERVLLSKLERRFVERLREAGLPLPATNRLAGGRRVDCRWPGCQLTVELDSYRYHSSRKAWEADRRREREAYARGDNFRRYTWDDVFKRPAPMIAELTGLFPPQAS